MKVLYEKCVDNRIWDFYYNAIMKYPNTYFPDDAERDGDKVFDELNKVGTQLIKTKNDQIKEWKGYCVDFSKLTGWYFAYKIEGDIIHIYDVENGRNMTDNAYRGKRNIQFPASSN